MNNIDIEKINLKLQNGSSLKQLSLDMGLGKDTLRKKLNRLGYKYNSQLRKVECSEQAIKPIAPSSKEVTQETKSKTNTKNSSQNLFLAILEEKQDIILDLIEKHERLANTSLEDSQETVTKSFRVGCKTWENFNRYCKQNGYKQSSILTKIIEEFLENKK